MGDSRLRILQPVQHLLEGITPPFFHAVNLGAEVVHIRLGHPLPLHDLGLDILLKALYVEDGDSHPQLLTRVLSRLLDGGERIFLVQHCDQFKSLVQTQRIAFHLGSPLRRKRKISQWCDHHLKSSRSN